jgi:hypothetical protein
VAAGVVANMAANVAAGVSAGMAAVAAGQLVETCLFWLHGSVLIKPLVQHAQHVQNILNPLATTGAHMGGTRRALNHPPPQHDRLPYRK